MAFLVLTVASLPTSEASHPNSVSMFNVYSLADLKQLSLDEGEDLPVSPVVWSEKKCGSQ